MSRGHDGLFLALCFVHLGDLHLGTVLDMETGERGIKAKSTDLVCVCGDSSLTEACVPDC